jgi:thiamine biosynthesis protein ThiI
MIIIRYDEIGLKSKFVRRKFEDTLVNNIRRALSKEFEIKAKVKRDYGRIYVLLNEKRIAKRVSKIFGIVKAEMAERMELDLPKNAIEIAKKWERKVKGKSFAVRVRRTGDHDFTSMDAARIIGQKVKELTGSKVDLKNPKVEIQVEIRDDSIYLIAESFPGYRGLPTGTQDRVISILYNEKSLLSTWFALKRGCDVDVLYNLKNEKLGNEINILEYWAAYRKINVFHSEGSLKKMLERAYELDHKGICCSITTEELDFVYKVLTKRTKPIYMPLLPFSNKEIGRMVKTIVEEVEV